MLNTFAHRPDRAVIIANPAAGTISTALVTELTRRCRLRVGNVSVHWATDPGDVAKVATRYTEQSVADPTGSTVLLAVGGDGTARAAVHGLASRTPGHGAVVMFIVPAGTSNSCYRSFWGDLAWQDALDAALANPAASARRLDLARLAETGVLVLAGASTGFPPQAISAARALTGPDGRARYSRAFADLATSFEPYPGRVVVDGVEVHSGQTMLANVGGSRYRGWHFAVLPHSVIDDGLLDVCVIGGEHDPADMMELARAGMHVTRSGVAYARGRTVTIERTDGWPVPFEHDGELLAGPGSRFTLEVVPHAVSMLVGTAADLGRRYDAA
jgi:diacylglycerol kinase (ATP)